MHWVMPKLPNGELSNKLSSYNKSSLPLYDGSELEGVHSKIRNLLGRYHYHP
jgi:hypothetical protein